MMSLPLTGEGGKILETGTAAFNAVCSRSVGESVKVSDKNKAEFSAFFKVVC